MSDFSTRVYRFASGAAAAYMIAFGLCAAIFPRAFFDVFATMSRPTAVAYAIVLLAPAWFPAALFMLEGTPIVALVKRNAPLICAAMHVIASIATLTLRTSHPRAMWILWMLTAISLVGFYAWWASRIGMLAPVAIAFAGIVCDFLGESMFITQPRLERIASLLTGGAANGLYTLAAILLTISTPSLPARWLAWIAWLSGIVLFIVTIFDWQPGLIASSATLMMSFVVWVVVFARS